MRLKLKNGGIAESLLNITRNNFMSPPVQNAQTQAPEDDEELNNNFDRTLGATMLAQPLSGTTALQNYGQGYLAADQQRNEQLKQKEAYRMHGEELKQKMVNTLIAVDEYKQNLEFKNRELDVSASHKNRQLDEMERHNLASEEITNNKAMQKQMSDQMSPIDKIISEGEEAKNALQTYERMKKNPDIVPQLNHTLSGTYKITQGTNSTIKKLFGSPTSEDFIKEAELSHYPTRLSGSIANALKNKNVDPKTIDLKVKQFRKAVAEKMPKNIKDIDAIAKKILGGVE